MAKFTNYATLSFNGGTAASNVVTGELLQILTAAKSAGAADYVPGQSITFVLSLLNSGTVPLTGLTVTDNLGGYAFETGTVYPLQYRGDSLRYYVNGALQSAPAVTEGAPLIISGISVPAGGNAMLIYEATFTDFAPLGADAAVTNQAVISGGSLTSPVTAETTVTAASRPLLRITKALSPVTVTEAGQLTYTFVIENQGSVAATATDQIVLADTFDPRLSNLTVSLDGTALAEGTQYAYNATTGVFSTAAGQITVPAATYAQAADGTWIVTPGAATVTITGTV